MSTYSSFAVILIASAVAGLIANRLRQPLIAAYIVVGIAAGPAGMGWVGAGGEIEFLAQIGVTVLLFVVGLKLDVHVVRHVGPVSLGAGLGQIAFTFLAGYLICVALRMDVATALYVAGALTLSSTIILVKLLSDRRELDSLHGRIVVGVLIVQDIVAVAAMTVLGSSENPGHGAAAVVVLLGMKLLLAAASVFVLMRYVLPPLLERLARSQELLMLFAVAWGIALAAFGEHLGFSNEVGAFLAGFSLASTPFREALSARLATLRDFLLLFFFIDLGARLQVESLGTHLGTALVLSLFVLAIKPLIVLGIMGVMGYRKRTSFLTAVPLAQVSEFSIVLLALGVSLGHIEQTALSIITLVALVTITASTYMIIFLQPLYQRVADWLSVFERRAPFRELAVERVRDEENIADVVVFGAGRFGRRLIEQLTHRRLRVLAVDFDPENVRALRHRHLHVRFGDAEDPEFARTLPLDNVSWVVSTLPEADATHSLVQALRARGFKGKVAVVVRSSEEQPEWAKRGATRVFRLYEDAADFAASDIAEAVSPRPR
ncbi:MAG: cation:proton antiporter [Burkholderiales bacterium]